MFAPHQIGKPKIMRKNMLFYMFAAHYLIKYHLNVRWMGRFVSIYVFRERTRSDTVCRHCLSYPNAIVNRIERNLSNSGEAKQALVSLKRFETNNFGCCFRFIVCLTGCTRTCHFSLFYICISNICVVGVSTLFHCFERRIEWKKICSLKSVGKTLLLLPGFRCFF